MSPMLPLPLLLVGLGIWMGIALRVVPRLHGAAALLFLALSVRYLVNFFHGYTAQPLAAGQSINSFVTLAICAMLLFFVRHQLLRYRAVLPVYAFMAAVVVSGLWNGEVAGTINAIIRLLLFVGTMIAIAFAADAQSNDSQSGRAIVALFAVPLLFQLLSVLLGVVKIVEGEDSISYIGGYVHEGVFSTMVLTGMAMVVCAAAMTWRKRTLLLLVLFAALLFANYRTAILAALPILFGHVVFNSTTLFKANMAIIVRTCALLAAGVLGILLAAMLAERMSDVARVLEAGFDLFRPPSTLTVEERSLMSGRIMIWNTYLFASADADISHFFLGFGPDSWQGVFALYAHNVFISYVYELGVVGSALFLFMMGHFIYLALTARRDKRWLLVCLHASYILLCLGTMPTFTIEGVLFYGVICGYTVYFKFARHAKTRFVFPANFPRSAAHRPARPAMGRLRLR